MRISIPMHCILLSSSLLLFGCAGECVLSDGKCPSGCIEAEASPVIDGADGPCTGPSQVLECREKGISTENVACVISPDGGTVYRTNGPSASRLIEEGYSMCTNEQLETASGATRCE
jgi:hypothetical protein